MVSSDASLDSDPDIARKKLTLLYKQSRASAVLNAIIALLLVMILWNQTSNAYLLLWLLAMTVVAAARVKLSIAYLKRELAPSEQSRWQRYYFLSLMLIATVWGVGMGLLQFTLAAVYQGLVLFFLMGIGGGFMVAHSVYRLHIVTFIPVLLTPSVLIALYEGSWPIRIAGVAALVFMIAGVNATRILTKMLHQNFLLTRELHDAKLEAEKLAHIDALTGLNNRRAFVTLSQRQLDLCSDREQPVTLIMADVDNFKGINDNYGHDAGDKALVFIADMIVNHQRKEDVSARLGGEEFVILLPGTAATEAMEYAEALRRNIEENPLILNGAKLSLCVSMGIASNRYNIDKLLSLADKAMYQAKKQGKNQVVEMTA